MVLVCRQIFDMVDERSREKCLKEIRLVQSLSHDNIIKYIDAFIENHELMLIFEYAEVRNIVGGVGGGWTGLGWITCGHITDLLPSGWSRATRRGT